MRELLAALPRTEVMGLVVFGLIILAFMVSAWMTWRTDRKSTKW
jgi:hypothetical protein